MLRNHSRVLAVVIFALTSLSADAQGPAPQATAEHKALAYEVGTWDAEAKMWMAHDAEPMTSKAVEINKMLGEQWIMSEFRGEVMGVPFVGHGQFGYDPHQKKYIGTWIDSFSPHLSVMEGTMDEATKTLTMMSQGFDSMLGKEVTSKMVSMMIDHDHKKFQIFMPLPGKLGEWWKQMEIDYTRRAK